MSLQDFSIHEDCKKNAGRSFFRMGIPLKSCRQSLHSSSYDKKVTELLSHVFYRRVYSNESWILEMKFNKFIRIHSRREKLLPYESVITRSSILIPVDTSITSRNVVHCGTFTHWIPSSGKMKNRRKWQNKLDPNQGFTKNSVNSSKIKLFYSDSRCVANHDHSFTFFFPFIPIPSQSDDIFKENCFFLQQMEGDDEEERRENRICFFRKGNWTHTDDDRHDDHHECSILDQKQEVLK